MEDSKIVKDQVSFVSGQSTVATRNTGEKLADLITNGLDIKIKDPRIISIIPDLLKFFLFLDQVTDIPKVKQTIKALFDDLADNLAECDEANALLKTFKIDQTIENLEKFVKELK